LKEVSNFLLVILEAFVLLPFICLDFSLQILPPVNFTLTVSALAEVLLQWKPNPDQEKNHTVEYNVEIMTPEWEPYETKKTCSTRTAVLHNGFSARIRTLLLYNNLQIESNWVTAKLQAPPGAVDTSVTNLSCVIYTAIDNTASLHCTWLAGKEAPEDTKYFLFYRYNSYTEECQEYSKDKWERNIGCRFSNTYIKTSEIDEVIVIHINGSSKYTAIKPFEQLFNPHAIDSKAYTILIALIVFICSVALLTAIICRKYHLWSRLFPPIPTPHNSLKNLFLNKSYQVKEMCYICTEETINCLWLLPVS
uniref:Interleukin 5 receptor subunit alpha n=1 Tax=Chelonoidis abingdonii TaxID=106734 RepID=A0A8C0IWZ1_CHEAB